MLLRRLSQRVFLAIMLIVCTVPWSGVLAQDAAAPGDPDFLSEKVDELLATPPLDSSPDQMYFLLTLMWSESLIRAGRLFEDPSFETDPHLKAQLIAETGVWDAVYRAASGMPPVDNPTMAPMQSDMTEAMRLSVDAGMDLRDFAMTGNRDSYDRAALTVNTMTELMGPWIKAFGSEVS